MLYTILVVDDSEDDVFLFRRMLFSSGLEVELSSTNIGVKGLELLRKQSFDCVFLDYNMPGADGLVILKEIKQVNPNIPVIMLTGQKNEKTIVELMQAGATDYLSKESLSPESLRISIENSRRIYLIQQEKSLADKALKKSEARLAEAQKIAHIGNWEYDYVKKEFWISDEAIRISELYKTDTNILRGFSKKIHYDDFHLFKETLQQIKNNEPIDISIRFYGWTKREKCLNIKAHLASGNKVVGTLQDITVLKTALLETQKAEIKNKATRIVLIIAIIIFLLSEAVLDPVIDSLTASLLVSLSFKGSIAVALKPLESILKRVMMSRLVPVGS
ncbi:MAG: ompR [Chitinophagaceae bacterium]|nr:ompR [Chitinophagaceae bacterium]